MPHSRGWLALFVGWCSVALYGCSTAEIRIQNVSPVDFKDVSIAGQRYGDIAASETSDYKPVRLKFRYTVVYLTADGHRVNAQTLNFGSRRFSYRVDIIDLDAGHLAVEIVRD